MNVTITRENFTEALEAVVAERGEDFVYPDEWREAPQPYDIKGRCQYSITDESGTLVGACIVGAVLERITGEPYRGQNEEATSILKNVFEVEDRRLIDAVSDAQLTQDWGETWGEALRIYKRTLGIV